MYRLIIIALPLLFLSPFEARSQWELLDTGLDTIEVPYSDPLTFGAKEVHFVDPARGILVRSDNRLLISRDSGTTWESRFLPGADYSANRDISFPVPEVGYIAGIDGLWKSTDLGESWMNITPLILDRVESGEAAVCFTDPFNGVYAYSSCYEPVVYFCRTEDGGESWSRTSRPFPGIRPAVAGITWLDGTWYAVGNNGMLWKSADGHVWTEGNTGSNGFHEDIVTAGGALWTVGIRDLTSCQEDLSLKSSFAMRSTDGGTTWSRTLIRGRMYGISALSELEAWVSNTRGFVYHTTDGGLTWWNESWGLFQDAPGGRNQLDDIFFINPDLGWAVGPQMSFRYRRPGPEPDRVICPGSPDELDFVGIVDSAFWTPATGLSCTDCPNPVAAPDSTTTYTVRYGVYTPRSELSDELCWRTRTVTVRPSGVSAELKVSNLPNVLPGKTISIPVRVASQSGRFTTDRLRLVVQYDTLTMQVEDPDRHGSDWMEGGPFEGGALGVLEHIPGRLTLELATRDGHQVTIDGRTVLKPTFLTYLSIVDPRFLEIGGENSIYVSEASFAVATAAEECTEVTPALSRISFITCGIENRRIVLGSEKFGIGTITTDGTAIGIELSLPFPGHVQLEIFSSMGERRSLLCDQSISAGSHRFSTGNAALPAGIYYCRATWGGQTDLRTVIIR